MLATIAEINKLHEEAGITEVGLWVNRLYWVYAYTPFSLPLIAESHELQHHGWGKRRYDSIYLKSQGCGCVPSLYDRNRVGLLLILYGLPQWFSSGTSFSEYAPGGHYKMFKEDKRENIIMVASEPLTFEKGEQAQYPTSTFSFLTSSQPIGWRSRRTT